MLDVESSSRKHHGGHKGRNVVLWIHGRTVLKRPSERTAEEETEETEQGS